jgi:hypothetical protein
MTTAAPEAPAGPAYPRTVLARNKMSGPTVLADSPKENFQVIFAGAGDPAGGDVQPIPDELVRVPAFARNIALGVIEIVDGQDNPAVARALNAQSAAFWQKNEAEKLSAMESLEAPKDDDLVAVQCIGPGTRADTQCEDTIPVRAREKDNQAPLCDRHAGLRERCGRMGTGPWKVMG